MDLKQAARQLKADIPAVFLALHKKETSVTAKVIAAVTIVYALSPIDLIPDFIPVLGYWDDILLLPGLIALTVKLIPDDILAECRAEGKILWENGRPKRWYCAIPVICIWAILLLFILRKLIS